MEDLMKFRRYIYKVAEVSKYEVLYELKDYSSDCETTLPKYLVIVLDNKRMPANLILVQNKTSGGLEGIMSILVPTESVWMYYSTSLMVQGNVSNDILIMEISRSADEITLDISKGNNSRLIERNKSK